MSTGGRKEPAVSWKVRAYRGVFSAPMIATVLSASAVRLLRVPLGNLVAARLADTSQTAMLNNALTLVIAVPVGVGLTAVLVLLRRRLIRSLLAYTGWVVDQTSLRTKAWAILLKLLVGPGPHKLYEFQDVLPRLPLPSLQHTCDKFLDTVRPLLSTVDYNRTHQQMMSLLHNEGPTLQNYLETRRATMSNWLADWWLSSSYLSRRDSIAVNVNFFMMSTVQPYVSNDHLARAAQSIYNITRYYEMIQDETLPPDMILGMVPLCMDSVRYMLGSCRIPGVHVDSLSITRHSRHVIIVSKGVYYRVEIYAKLAADGKKYRLCSKKEFKRQLQHIVEQTADVKHVDAVAALTSTNRTDWALNRERLLQSSENADILQDIESAMFILVLADFTPQNEQEQARIGLTGDGTSRWFDKCLTLEMFKDTTMAIGNMEHSGTDATHFAVMWEHILQEEEYGPDGDVLDHCMSLPDVVLEAPKRLDWVIDNELKVIIQHCFDDYQNVIADVDLVLFHTKFGKKWMKRQRMSPDGFLQMAIQLAYWRLHGEFTKTYEPASHRLFALGRTENINPVTEESIKWVRMMADRSKTSTSADDDTQRRLLREAVDQQSRLRLEATVGGGSDRHLMGLACAARELGMDLPALFSDKAYQLPMKLSTSQVPTNIGQHGLELIPESCLGGFGPVCDDGYGLLYCSIGDMFNFNITSWRHCDKTDSRRLANAIEVALDDMRQLLDVTNSPSLPTCSL